MNKKLSAENALLKLKLVDLKDTLRILTKYGEQPKVRITTTFYRVPNA